MASFVYEYALYNMQFIFDEIFARQTLTALSMRSVEQQPTLQDWSARASSGGSSSGSGGGGDDEQTVCKRRNVHVLNYVKVMVMVMDIGIAVMI